MGWQGGRQEGCNSTDIQTNQGATTCKRRAAPSTTPVHPPTLNTRYTNSSTANGSRTMLRKKPSRTHMFPLTHTCGSCQGVDSGPK